MTPAQSHWHTELMTKQRGIKSNFFFSFSWLMYQVTISNRPKPITD